MTVDRDQVAQALDKVAAGRASGIAVRPDGNVGLVLAVDGLVPAAVTKLLGTVEIAVRALPGVTGVRIIQTAERGTPPAEPRPIRILAVASGKGGVGKSTISVNLAVALARRGLKIGLLDADIYGPSIPTLIDRHERAELVGNRLQPVDVFGIKALSMGMMTDPGKAIIWRGPMASSALTQMVELADWGDPDLLVVDMPPGTGDIQLTMAQKLKPVGAVIVSTPQDLALIDARRAISMFEQSHVPVLGIIENMGSYVCPDCGGTSHPFGHGGAEAEAEALGVPFLGRIPLAIAIREASDAGRPPASGDGPDAAAFKALATAVATALRL